MNDHLLNEEDNEQEDDRGKIDPAEIRHVSSDADQRRFDYALQRFVNHANEIITHVDNAKGHQPADDHGSEDQPGVDTQGQHDDVEDREHGADTRAGEFRRLLVYPARALTTTAPGSFAAIRCNPWGLL